MSMFDGLMGNVEEIAARFGLPADQLQEMMSGLASGNFDIAAMTAMAQQHGLTPEKMQEMLASFGGMEGLGGTLGELFGKDGANPLASFTKGLFG